MPADPTALPFTDEFLRQLADNLKRHTFVERENEEIDALVAGYKRATAAESERDRLREENERLRTALDSLLSTLTQLDADVSASSGAALEKAFAAGRKALENP